jgi:PhzF family phenazine biosynthesis protein
MLRFSQVDVFTDEFMVGNPVAVVHDADDVSADEMAAFARWTNLSETTFLLSPTVSGADYRLRIFTPQRELPFAGHPTLGSATAWLAAGGVPAVGSQVVQQCAVGNVRIRRSGKRLAFAAPPLVRGGPVDQADVDQLTGALHLTDDQLVAAQWADNGPGWVVLLVTDASTVLAIEPDFAAFGKFTSVGVIGPYPAGSDVDFEVRAFAPTLGVGEDPVTGSLNAAIAQWLIPAGLAASSYTASQGTRLRRRGRVYLEQSENDIWVGGDTVIGVSGTVALPA